MSLRIIWIVGRWVASIKVCEEFALSSTPQILVGAHNVANYSRFLKEKKIEKKKNVPFIKAIQIKFERSKAYIIRIVRVRRHVKLLRPNVILQ